MKIAITFDCRARFSNEGRIVVQGYLKDNINKFFKHCANGPKSIHVCMLKASRGGPRDTFIKLIPTSSSATVPPNNVLAMIYSKGTQGIECFISSPDVSADELKKFVTFGPYTGSVPRFRPAVVTRAMEKSVAGHVETGNVAVIESREEDLPKETHQEPASSQEKHVSGERFSGKEGIEEARMSKTLLESGLPQHDLELLRVFMSELVEPYLAPFLGENKSLPEFIEIPCTVISKKMEKEWAIPCRRGGFGMLYHARISHFGYKSENIPKGERYNTWLFHVKTVLNFANGLHKIPRKPKGEGTGLPGNGGGSGVKYHLTETVSPISDKVSLIDILFSKPVGEKPLKELAEYSALIEEVEQRLASKQRLQAQLADEQVLISKDEDEVKAIEQSIADLENRKAKAQVVLVERRARAADLEKRIEGCLLPKKLRDQLKDTLEKVQTVAKLAGIDTPENK